VRTFTPALGNTPLAGMAGMAGRSGAASRVSPVSSVPTACPGCGRATRTVFGRCPHCGFGKEARRVGATPRTLRGGSWWDDLDIGLDLAVALVVLPGLALVAAVLVFVLGIELIVVAAIVAMLVLLALGLAALA
jgi:ribosomal protein L37E